MIVDTFFWACTATLLVVFLLSVVFNPFRRRPHMESKTAEAADSSEKASLPAVSIVVVAHDETTHLEQHLMELLDQDYSADFEVVVVTEQGDLEAENILKRHADEPRLRSTYIPARSLFMSREKLAVSLGVKAAKGEWIVLLNADCRPTSPHWLSAMATQFDSSRNVVIGYCNFPQEAKPWYRFSRLRRACYVLRAAQKDSFYRSIGFLLAFKRTLFIDQFGFRQNLQYVHGAYDFIASELGQNGMAAASTLLEAKAEQDEPSKKMWREHNVGYESIRRALQGSTKYFLLQTIDLFFMYVSYLLSLATIVFASLTARWLLLGVAVLVLIMTLVVRLLLAKKTLKAFDEHIALWRVFGYELSIGFRNVAYRLRYLFSNKSDYTTHKL